MNIDLSGYDDVNPAVSPNPIYAELLAAYAAEQEQ